MQKPKTVTEIIESVKEDMCDRYCKMRDYYLSMYKDPDEANEHMLNEQCDHCPLQRL